MWCAHKDILIYGCFVLCLTCGNPYNGGKIETEEDSSVIKNERKSVMKSIARRTLACLLAVVMLVGIIPAAAATESGELLSFAGSNTINKNHGIQIIQPL